MKRGRALQRRARAHTQNVGLGNESDRKPSRASNALYGETSVERNDLACPEKANTTQHSTRFRFKRKCEIICAITKLTNRPYKRG